MVRGRVEFETEMFLARQEDEWGRVSEVIAALYNTRFGADKWIDPRDVNPIKYDDVSDDAEEPWERAVREKLEREKQDNG